VLDEAMATKQVTIREISDGSVNSLTFVNRAKHPVFVLAGEVILGGKQDRIIGRNTVIPASTTQEVPVYCVEHGRWTGETKEFSTAKALAHGRLRGQASYRAQGDVWNEVAAKNVARKTVNSSDTYRRVAQQQSDGTLSRMEKQVDAALARIPAADRGRMVGYAVALNGAVATVDVFGSPTLFKKLETKLIRSYLTEAVDVAAKKDAKPPTTTDVKAFIADAEKAAEQKSYDTPAAATSVKGGERAFKAKVGYKLRKAPSAAAAPAADAAPEPTVYENYQAK
jgi:ARG/rhodanese/phosphatase superfamily protein